jgi:hypothetical protein
MGIDSRRAQARSKDTRFGHQFPPGYNRSVLAESSTAHPNVGEYKGSNSCHYRGLPRDNPWDTGQTKDNLQSISTPPITTIARLRLTSRSNTIALRMNTERRTREYGLGLTHHGIK